MKTSATYLFAGGGTGGHLFPGIAVSQELRRRAPDARLVFVGSRRTVETSIVAQFHLEHRILPVESLAVLKRNPLIFAVRNWQAFRSADRLIAELRPRVVIGLGGFASAPVIWAAGRRKVPVVLLEQNVVPGRTTRWLSRFADCVCVSFAETIPRLSRSSRVVVTGNPVRDEIRSLRRSELPSVEQEKLYSGNQLLILGGSQGADSLNNAAVAALTQIRESMADWQIVHQTGPRQVEQVRDAYLKSNLNAIVEPFFADLADRYSRASLVISRAGATTLAEVACVGIASILLPFPHAADNHQRENAKVFVEKQAGILIEHRPSPNETADLIADTLRQLVPDLARRRAMSLAAMNLGHPVAASAIADQIGELA